MLSRRISPRLHVFASSRLHVFISSQLHLFAASSLHDLAPTRHSVFASFHLRAFRFHDIVPSLLPVFASSRPRIRVLPSSRVRVRLSSRLQVLRSCSPMHRPTLWRDGQAQILVRRSHYSTWEPRNFKRGRTATRQELRKIDNEVVILFEIRLHSLDFAPSIQCPFATDQ